MTKGRPWDINEERRLRDLVEEGKGLEEISQIMVKTRDAIRQKMFDLKLTIWKEKKQVIFHQKKPCFFSSKLELPSDLPTIEETLQILAAALWKSAEAGLNKDEVQRLQVVSNLAKTYKEAFADYANYLGIEERLAELEAKQDVPVKKT
jgi:hypothetical protein